MPAPLGVVFLIGGDSPSTRLSIDSVCQVPGVKPSAILLDTAGPPLSRRIKNLRRNIRRDGLAYFFWRTVDALHALTERAVENVTPAHHARELLQRAFPERRFDLAGLADKYGMKVVRTGNLNSPAASAALAQLKPDLGIVLGTRVLRRSTFGIPRLGCINLHKGEVPKYRGMPPGFWEIYNGEKHAGVTAHFIDDTLDTGDVVATGRVEILPFDTPDTLRTKLDVEGAATLAGAVVGIRTGAARPDSQSHWGGKPYSKPTRAQVSELRKRLPRWRRVSPGRGILKNVFALGVYYSGLFALVKWWHGRSRARAGVILYHRVNDLSKDGITTSLERFAGHMLMIARWYNPISTGDLVARTRERLPLPPHAVAIHFDDCYRDVCTNARPLLEECGFPAAAFVSSGFVGTDRVFAHDLRTPFRFDNLSVSDLRGWLAAGFEIGAHTVNHTDLGACPVSEGKSEITESVRQLERMTATKITLFSFPFGLPKNIRHELRHAVVEAGCHCVFSAYGGFIDARTDIYDIPRLGTSWMHSPLFLALELEAVSPGAIARRLRLRREPR